MNNGIHIVHLYADSANEWNCSQWRCLIPADAVNEAYEAGKTPNTVKLWHMPTAMDWHHPKVQKELGMADVIVFQRNVIAKEIWDVMDYWRALGKAVIVDSDDHYPALPPSNPAFQYWIRNLPGLDPAPVDAFAEGLKHADAFTSPSKIILRDWEHIIPGYWVPNWTRGKWYEGLAQKPHGAPDIEFGYVKKPDMEEVELKGTFRPDSEGQIIIGWGGSISHVDSWIYSGAIEALDRIFEKHPKARLKFCGFEQRLDYLLNRWGDRVVRQPGVRPEHWPQVVSTFDIGVAPLDMRQLEPWREGAPVASYDERRSWLKAVEYLCAGVPWMASKSLTYADLARHGKVVDNTADAWFAALDGMITRLPQVKAEAWAKRRWAMKHVTFEANVNAYGDIMTRILNEKHMRAGATLPGIVYVAQKQTPIAAVAGAAA